LLDPNSWAANAPAQAAFSGLQMLAPNMASLLTGQPAPALPNFPAMPGKVPSTDDPRIVGAIGEAANNRTEPLASAGHGLIARSRPGVFSACCEELRQRHRKR
jgi:hypothetical protein